jgi:amino acid transporter
MDVSEQVQLQLVRGRLSAVQSLLLIQQRLVLLALLAATVIAPLTAMVRDADSDDPSTEARGLFGSLGYFFDSDADTFGDRDSHPHGLDAGLTATRVGLVLLLVAVVCAIIVVLASWAGRRRWTRPVLITVAVALVVAAGVTFLGLTWLPDSEFVTAATGWLWLPVGAGAAAVYHLWWVQRLE